MKGLFLATALMGGGGVAATNETVVSTVQEGFQQVMNRIGFENGNFYENVKENGYPYPSEEYLATLTEEQATAIITQIDIINATYDFQNMSDEEIDAAFIVIREDMHALYTELGVEPPVNGTRARHGKHWNEDFVPNGDGSRDGSCTQDDSVVTEGDIV